MTIDDTFYVLKYKRYDPTGYVYWVNDEEQYHRENGPAIIYSPDKHRKNHLEWYINGKLHREDGPAVMRLDGTVLWYQNGKIHRDGGPAVIYPDGESLWYKEGIFQVEDHTKPYDHE